MENQNLNSLDIKDVPDKEFTNFQMLITPEKISDFFAKSLSNNEKSNSKDKHKLSKHDFISIFQSIFSKESDNIYLNKIFDLIFERLKERKCLFKINNPYSSKNYALCDIISTDKIEIFKVELFLCVSMLSDFKKKLKIMFHIIDSDNDGLINKAEIQKLIITTNQLFFGESIEKFSNSSLIQQSLSSYRANKTLNKLLYGQSNLENILINDKCINFEDFYEKISKIDKFKYDIIPTFINLKNFLSDKKEEIEIFIRDKCKKDFMDISYELINRNNELNLVSPKNHMKSLFDKKKKIAKIKIDPLKEIKAKKEKEKELKFKRLIESKKKEFGQGFNFFKHLPISKSVLITKASNDIKFQTSNKITNEQDFICETPFVNTNQLDSNTTNNNNNDEEIKYRKINNSLKKTKTAEYKNKFTLYSGKEGEKIVESKQKKLPNTFPFLKASKKKSKLNKIYDIPMEVSPFNITDVKDKHNIQTSNKIINPSENNDPNKMKTKINTNSDVNYDSNYSTLGMTSPLISDRNNNFFNLKKISIFNKTKKDLCKTTFRKKRLIESISPINSLINTTSRKTIPYTTLLNNKKKEKIELGDYIKFSSLLFPPCIIRTKENNNKSFFMTKNDFNYKKKKLVNKKYEGFDKAKTLLRTYEEIKNDIFGELELQRNNNINDLYAMVKMKNNINNNIDKFHFVDFKKNKVDLTNFFIINADKKKKSNYI